MPHHHRHHGIPGALILEDLEQDPPAPPEGHVAVYFKAGKVYRMESSGTVTELGAGAGGGAALSAFQRAKTDGGGIPLTTYAPVAWNLAEFADAGFTYAAGELTIGAELDGKKAVVDVHLGLVGANNRTELNLALERDTGSGFEILREAKNYATRDANQNEGDAAINGVLVTLTAGHVYRVQACYVRDSSSPGNYSATGCWWSIRTLE